MGGKIFSRDIFGRPLFVKRTLVRMFGLFFYPRFNWKYNVIIEGAEVITDLPETGVLFISNHQTYFADVALIYQVIQNAKIGAPNDISKLGFWKLPFRHMYYVAALETMKSGLIPKLMTLTGAITIKRTWREKGQEIQREVDQKDTSNIAKALATGWVLTFPQGTTKPFSPVRKGTAHIIKSSQPIVVPIVIDGFRRGFDKKGLKTKKKHVDLKMKMKAPVKFEETNSIEFITEQIAKYIQQSSDYQQYTIATEHKS